MSPVAAQGEPVDVMVFGAGAIGLWVGGMLAQSGLRVHFVARAGTVGALRARGLKLYPLDGAERTVAPDSLSASESLDEAPQARLMLLTVKGTATREAAEAIERSHLAGTPLISFQNGVDNPGRVRAASPRTPVLAGMVPYNVIIPEPGTVRQASDGRLMCARDAVSESWTAAFARAGIPLDLRDDMAAVQWGKLLLNLNNPVNALTGLPLREQLLDRRCRKILAGLQREALDAMGRAGIRPARVTPLPTHWLPAFLSAPNAIFVPLATRILRIRPDARSSMYDDRAAGRATEIDDLCGAVIRLAESTGLDAPLNRRMRSLVLESEPGRFYAPEALARALHDAA